jgi:hypothetical protein
MLRDMLSLYDNAGRVAGPVVYQRTFYDVPGIRPSARP